MFDNLDAHKKKFGSLADEWTPSKLSRGETEFLKYSANNRLQTSQIEWFVNHLASAFTVKDPNCNYSRIVNEPPQLT